MRRLLPVILAVLTAVLASCDNGTRPDFVVHLVDGSGGNPFASTCTNASVRIDVAQYGQEVLTTNGSITAGQPSSTLSVQIPSYGLATQIQVVATCSTGTTATLMGSTPVFVPTGVGFVNVVLGAPEDCITLQQPILVPAMVDPQLVRMDANVVAIGGIDGSGAPNESIQGFDTVTLTHVAQPLHFDGLTAGFGIGHALRLDATRILFVSPNISGSYDVSQGATTRYRAIDGLHAGAGNESALVDLLGYGFAIVGGADGDEAVNGITWITVDAAGLLTVTHGTLAFARRQPAAVFLQGNKLLVAGGQADGEPLFEIITIQSTGDPAIPFGTATEARFGAVLTTDATHARAFLALGSADAQGASAQRDTTFELTSCVVSPPTPGCAVASGPTFADARAGVAAVQHVVGAGATGGADSETLLLGGEDGTGSTMLVDRIRFDATTMHFVIEPAGMLQASRSQPGATEIGGGVVLVGGGADRDRNPLGTVELCFPRFLAPIVSM